MIYLFAENDDYRSIFELNEDYSKYKFLYVNGIKQSDKWVHSNISYEGLKDGAWSSIGGWSYNIITKDEMLSEYFLDMV